jgi:hypothetical protein
MTELRIPTNHFRSLPPPLGLEKIGLFHARVGTIPSFLADWKAVNPRDVKRSGVWNQIKDTLIDEPERFFQRNRGLTISASNVEYDEKKKEVVILLLRPELHGLLDGGHTFDAIQFVLNNPAEDSPTNSSIPADVFIKVITGVTEEQIAEIAGGLNSSKQVDLTSITNLHGYFEKLQMALRGQPYENLIAYKMFEDKPIPVQEILYYLAVFDAESYSETKHPTALFGRKEGIVRNFAKQAETGVPDSPFQILVTRAPDILRLRDLIEQKVAAMENIGHFNVDKKGKKVGHKSHRKNPLHFLDTTIDKKISLGWIMPMLGGFRANVDWNKPKGSFSWKLPNDELLDRCMEPLFEGIKEIHIRENRRPEYVGRNFTAWRTCYDTVRTAILQEELNRLKK